jgi:hypothetical protein
MFMGVFSKQGLSSIYLFVPPETEYAPAVFAKSIRAQGTWALNSAPKMVLSAESIDGPSGGGLCSSIWGPLGHRGGGKAVNQMKQNVNDAVRLELVTQLCQYCF